MRLHRIVGITPLTLALSDASIISSVILAAPASAGPDLPGTNCETNFWGALYCDGPVRADGSWARCVTSQPSTTWTGDASPPIYNPGYHKCWVYNPADPATFNFSPDHHIGDGL